MTNFFERPLIPLQPNPEPEEFPLYRDMMFRRVADLQADPYGGQKFSNRGRGSFDPRTGGYGPARGGRPGSGPGPVGPRPGDPGMHTMGGQGGDFKARGLQGGFGGGKAAGGGVDIQGILRMLAQRMQQGGGKPGARPTNAGMQAARPDQQRVQAPLMAGHDAAGPGLPGPYESNFPAGTTFPASARAGDTLGSAAGGFSGGGGGGGMMKRRRPMMTGHDGTRPWEQYGRPGQGGWRDILGMEGSFDQSGAYPMSGPGMPQTPNGPGAPRNTNPSAPPPSDPRFDRWTSMNSGPHGSMGTTPTHQDPNNPFGMANQPPRGMAQAAPAAAPVQAGHDAARMVNRMRSGPRTVSRPGGGRAPGGWGPPPSAPSGRNPGGWGPSAPPSGPGGRGPAEAMAGGGWGPPSGGFPGLRGL